MKKVKLFFQLLFSYNFWRIIHSDFVDKKSVEISLENQIVNLKNWLLSGFKFRGNTGFPIAFIPKLGTKWSVPFVETTGYIIVTLIDYHRLTNDKNCIDAAVDAGNWLIHIQSNEGWFPTNDGHFSDFRKIPYVFDTGQDIFGLVELFKYTNNQLYLISAIKAADWLTSVQEPMGFFSKNAYSVGRTYYIQVIWAIAEVFQITKSKTYLDVINKFFLWFYSENFDGSSVFPKNCAFTDEGNQHLHLIGYVIRSLLELRSYDERNLNYATSMIDFLICERDDKLVLAGSYGPSGVKDYTYRCLTGEAQVGICSFIIYQLTGQIKYYNFAMKIRIDIDRVISRFEGESIGGVPGSYPFWGKYERFLFPNWATKYYLDLCLILKYEKLPSQIIC